VRPSNVLVFSYPDENHVCADNPQKWNCESCVHVDGAKVLVKLSDFDVGIRASASRPPSDQDSEDYKAPEITGFSSESMTGRNEKVISIVERGVI